MNIVVDERVAVLEVLTLRDTVGSNEDIDVALLFREKQFTLLRYRREEGQDGVEVIMDVRHVGLGATTGDETGVHAVLTEDSIRQNLIEVFSRVAEGGEDDNLLVLSVDRMTPFVADILNK